MLFNEKFIHSVEENPILGIVEACALLKSTVDNLSLSEWDEEAHEILWEGASFLDIVIATNKLNIELIFPEATGDISNNCQELYEYITSIEKEFILP